MKKLMLIFFFLPMICFGQDNSNPEINAEDAIVTAIIAYSFDFLTEDDYAPNGKFKISSNKDSINWNSKQFTKWKIIQPKDSIISEL